MEQGTWYKGEGKNYYFLQEAVIYFSAPGDHGSEEDCVLHIYAASALSIALGAHGRGQKCV